MTEKLRVRVKSGRYAFDSYQNLQARLGKDSGNLMDGATYAQSNLLTRTPRTLEFMYRGSWIVGAAVDAIADDMTRAGVDFGAAIEPDTLEATVSEMHALELWQGIGDVIRWARLYGGAIGVMLIDGQDMATPLRLKTIKQGQFKGILPLDRWSLVLTVDQLVNGLGPALGRPEFYTVGPNAPALVGQKIHHSRVIRMEGIRLPFIQRQAEQGWGLSIIERMFDRLTAFDSATTGAAQLVYKAYLRTLKKEGLNQILSAGGPAFEALAKNMEAIRRFQSTEGLTLIDAKDTFETHTYTFAGLDDLLLQFGQQISGATGIPLVRLFGQSPAGLNSTGEGDIRNYYDGINAQQNRILRGPLDVVLRVLHQSVTGEAPPENFNFAFNPLWQLSEKEKSDIAKTTTEAVAGALDAAIIGPKTAMQELKQSADVTGIFSNITDEQIEAADEEPPAPPEMGEGPPPPGEDDDEEGGGAKPGAEATDDARPFLGDADFREEDHPRREDGKFGEGGGSAKPGAAPKSGASAGFGTSHVKAGDPISFRMKGGELSGVVKSVSAEGARVEVDGRKYKVPWAAVTGGKTGPKSKPAEGASGRGDHFVPPEKFNATDYAKSHDDAKITPADILAHFPPDTADKIRAAQQRLASIEQTIAVHKKDGVYDAGRKALHRKIIIEGLTKKVLNPETGELEDKHFPGILSPDAVKAATPADGKKPTFTVLGGRGGSGKSWFEGQVYDPKKAIVLDSDHIKGLLPEYEGWNAAQVHEESGEIFDAITEMAKQMGLNIVHDATMKDPKKAVRLVEQFKKEGYRVEAHYMHLPRQEAAKRAVSRFLGKSKRLVPPDVVLSNRENEKSFEEVRGMVDRWSFRDNNVPKGDPPRLISEGGAG